MVELLDLHLPGSGQTGLNLVYHEQDIVSPTNLLTFHQVSIVGYENTISSPATDQNHPTHDQPTCLDHPVANESHEPTHPASP